MSFKSINDITPLTVRQFREEKGLSQRAFWEAIHVPKGTGCRIESGQKILTDTLRLVILETYGTKDDDKLQLAREKIEQGMALMKEAMTYLTNKERI